MSAESGKLAQKVNIFKVNLPLQVMLFTENNLYLPNQKLILPYLIVRKSNQSPLKKGAVS